MKIKKLLPLVFAAISVSLFGGTHDLQTNLSEINGKIITDRGRSQFRESVMFKKWIEEATVAVLNILKE